MWIFLFFVGLGMEWWGRGEGGKVGREKETIDQKLKLKDTLHFVINAGPAVLIYLEFDIKYPTRSAETTLKFWITLLVFLMWGASKTPLPVLLV